MYIYLHGYKRIHIYIFVGMSIWMYENISVYIFVVM